jgi:hypothetical protein
MVFQKSLLTSQKQPSTPLRGSSVHYRYGQSFCESGLLTVTFLTNFGYPCLKMFQICEVQNGRSGQGARELCVVCLGVCVCVVCVFVLVWLWVCECVGVDECVCECVSVGGCVWCECGCVCV